MKTRLLFRQSGYVIPTRSLGAALWDWAWPVLAISSLLATLGLAGYWDTRAETERVAADLRRDVELQRAFNAGRQQGHDDMLATAQAGWDAAKAEAELQRQCVPVRRMP